MANLETSVLNRTELLLIIRDFYKECKTGGGSKKDESDEIYGSQRYAVAAGETKTINSGQFVVAYNKRLKALCNSMRCSQQIHVCCCEHVLLVLSDNEFQKNRGKDLILDMLDSRLRFAFVYPNTIVHQWIWIWGKPPVCSITALMLEQSIWSEQGFEIGRMESLKTKVTNKTELVLTLMSCSEEIRLAAGGTAIFTSGKLCRNRFGILGTSKCGKLGTNKRGEDKCQLIHVCCCELVLLVLKVDDFQNNKGKVLLLDLLDNRLGYAFVYPISNIGYHTWIWGEPCNLSELDQRIWSEKGFKRGNMKDLETTVVNNTELQLTLLDLQGKGWKEWDNGDFGRDEFRIPGHGRMTIRSGNFVKARERRPWGSFLIGVWSGQYCLLELENDHFQKNKGKRLIFEVVDDSLRYTFVYPTAHPSQWIKCRLPLPLTFLKEKDQRVVHDQECESMKTRVVNRSDFLLTLAEYTKYELHLTGRGDPLYKDRYGKKKIRVGEGGAKTICLGEFFKREKRQLLHRLVYKEIHVLRGGEVMLVLNSHHFHNNKGKQLVLDMPQGHLTFAFLSPTPPKPGRIFPAPN